MAPTQRALRWLAWRFRWWRWTKMATSTWHTSNRWWELSCCWTHEDQLTVRNGSPCLMMQSLSNTIELHYVIWWIHSVWSLTLTVRTLQPLLLLRFIVQCPDLQKLINANFSDWSWIDYDLFCYSLALVWLLHIRCVLMTHLLMCHKTIQRLQVKFSKHRSNRFFKCFCAGGDITGNQAPSIFYC